MAFLEGSDLRFEILDLLVTLGFFFSKLLDFFHEYQKLFGDLG